MSNLHGWRPVNPDSWQGQTLQRPSGASLTFVKERADGHKALSAPSQDSPTCFWHLVIDINWHDVRFGLHCLQEGVVAGTRRQALAKGLQQIWKLGYKDWVTWASVHPVRRSPHVQPWKSIIEVVGRLTLRLLPAERPWKCPRPEMSSRSKQLKQYEAVKGKSI